MKSNGKENSNHYVIDELEGTTKEMWDITRFPKLSKKQRRKFKKLNFGKFIVYGTKERK